MMRNLYVGQEVGRWRHSWMVGWNHAVVAGQVAVFLIELKMHGMDVHSVEIAERLMVNVMRVIAASRLALFLLAFLSSTAFAFGSLPWPLPCSQLLSSCSSFSWFW